MKLLMQALLSLLVCGQALAFFSEHAVVTLKNLDQHKDFKAWLYTNKGDPNMVNVVLPFYKGDKKYWLFTCTRELKDEELEFRNIVWYPYQAVPDFVQRIAPIAPMADRSGRVSDGAFIRLKIRKDVLAKTYLYQDFAQGVEDGGWYRTYKLSDFPIGEGIDPIMKLEWDISRYDRIGDNSKHREAEHKLRRMLADKEFMKQWGQRYKEEQDGADQPATAPESKSESNSEPQSESEGRSQ